MVACKRASACGCQNHHRGTDGRSIRSSHVKSETRTYTKPAHQERGTIRGSSRACCCLRPASIWPSCPRQQFREHLSAIRASTSLCVCVRPLPHEKFVCVCVFLTFLCASLCACVTLLWPQRPSSVQWFAVFFLGRTSPSAADERHSIIGIQQTSNSRHSKVDGQNCALLMTQQPTKLCLVDVANTHTLTL